MIATLGGKLALRIVFPDVKNERHMTVMVVVEGGAGGRSLCWI